MSPLANEIVLCIGDTGLSELRIADLLSQPLPAVKKEIKALVKKKVITKKSGADKYKYWLTK